MIFNDSMINYDYEGVQTEKSRQSQNQINLYYDY